MSIADLGREGPDTTIVASVIELAHALGFEAVAEGVEDDVQLRALIELGCDLVQGHLVAHASPSAAAAEVLAQREPLAAGGFSRRAVRDRATAS